MESLLGRGGELNNHGEAGKNPFILYSRLILFPSSFELWRAVTIVAQRQVPDGIVTGSGALKRLVCGPLLQMPPLYCLWKIMYNKKKKRGSRREGDDMVRMWKERCLERVFSCMLHPEGNKGGGTKWCGIFMLLEQKKKKIKRQALDRERKGVKRKIKLKTWLLNGRLINFTTFVTIFSWFKKNVYCTKKRQYEHPV